MLEAINLSHQTTRPGAEPLTQLDSVHFLAPGGHFLAVIGAAGSGKTTLLQTLGGLSRVQSGAILWHGRDLAQNWLQPGELGSVATDEAALQPLMSVKEHLVCGLLLAIGGITQRDALLRAERLMVLCGLEAMSGQRVASLQKVQRRRLSLALALIADPPLLLCDDFTSGLDPKAEQEMLALLQTVAKNSPHRLVVHATSDLANLKQLRHGAAVARRPGLLPRTGPRGSALLQHRQHRGALCAASEASLPALDGLLVQTPRLYYDAFKLMSGGTSGNDRLASAEEEEEPAPDRLRLRPRETAEPAEPVPLPPPSMRPGFGTQLSVLMRRRWTIFRRAKVVLWVHAALLLGLPLLALAFFWPALDELRALQKGASTLSDPGSLAYLGVFASGFLMLQVLTVLIMAVRLGAEEIAERALALESRAPCRAALQRLRDEQALLCPAAGAGAERVARIVRGHDHRRPAGSQRHAPAAANAGQRGLHHVDAWPVSPEQQPGPGQQPSLDVCLRPGAAERCAARPARRTGLDLAKPS